MPICTRCGKDIDGVHTCVPSEVYAFDDLMKRLDGLERFEPMRPTWAVFPVMVNKPEAAWTSFEQVKSIVGQWIADQGAKP